MTVTIQPLPEPAPAAFSGAVGQIKIFAEADVANATVNEPVTVRMTLQGRGNVNAWPDLTLSEWNHRSGYLLKAGQPEKRRRGQERAVP